MMQDLAGHMARYVSPRTGDPLMTADGELKTQRGESFPVIGGIPRFVSSEDYAASFGLQWRIHDKTQLDSETHASVSRERLERCLGNPLSQMRAKTVLEAGCGAGRFTELLVNAGAWVHAIDLSRAVEANFGNIGPRENYSIAQASLLSPPFPPGQFQVVLCLGVLQHLPSPEEGIRALWNMVTPGGLLVIDHYALTWSALFKLSHVYRYFLIKLPPETAKKVTDRLVDWCFPVHWRFRDHRLVQAFRSQISPCLFYYHLYPQLEWRQQYEWSILDSFDNLTDRYKHLRTAGQIQRVLQSLDAVDVWAANGGNGIEARARKRPVVRSGVSTE